MLAVTLAGCIDINNRTDAESTSAELFALNTQAAHEYLEHFLCDMPDTLQADIAVMQHYKEDSTWLWASTPEQTKQAGEVIRYLSRQVADMGFAPDAFYLPQVEADIERLDSLRFDSLNTMDVVMARTELNLSRAYLKYCRGQRYGFMNPVYTFNHSDLRNGQAGNYRQLFDIDVEQPDSLFFSRALSQAVDGNALGFLRQCEPHDSLYARFKQALIIDSVEESRHRLMCNMERRRWRTDESTSPDGRRVFVNLPSQQLWAIGPDSVFSMRICFGAWKTKTPLLHSAISLLEINPEWIIPGSIVRDEVSRRAGDSAYFARNRYYIVNRSTAPHHVSASQLRSGGYRVAQHSGRGNSLGRLIFRFPNQHAVYLHDTSNRNAFNAEKRSISHGCVRVERPFDLAVFLLPEADEWMLDRIRLSIDMNPVSQRGQQYLKDMKAEGKASSIRLIQSATISPRVPVQLSYYTVYPNPETGILETWPDRYEYDKTILKWLTPFLR